MAGSLNHCLDDAGNYRGTDLLENMGDMAEAVEQMAFIILHVRRAFWGGDKLIARAEEEYYQCCRGERPWPEYMRSDKGK